MLLLAWLAPVLAANWAILVATSGFWYDYRHTTNVLLLRKQLKELGMPDNRILLLTAGNTACDPHNPFPGRHLGNDTDLYDSISPHLRGLAVNPLSVAETLTTLKSDALSNVFLYITGHGGPGFVKFQDSQVLSAQSLQSIVDVMSIKHKFREMLVVVDSCSSATMKVNGVSFVSSSEEGKSSYSVTYDKTLGTSPVDKFTFEFASLLKEGYSLDDTIKLMSGLKSTPVVAGTALSNLTAFFEDQCPALLGVGI